MSILLSVCHKVTNQFYCLTPLIDRGDTWANFAFQSSGFIIFATEWLQKCFYLILEFRLQAEQPFGCMQPSNQVGVAPTAPRVVSKLHPNWNILTMDQGRHQETIKVPFQAINRPNNDQLGTRYSLSRYLAATGWYQSLGATISCREPSRVWWLHSKVSPRLAISKES